MEDIKYLKIKKESIKRIIDFFGNSPFEFNNYCEHFFVFRCEIWENGISVYELEFSAASSGLFFGRINNIELLLDGLNEVTLYNLTRKNPQDGEIDIIKFDQIDSELIDNSEYLQHIKESM